MEHTQGVLVCTGLPEECTHIQSQTPIVISWYHGNQMGFYSIAILQRLPEPMNFPAQNLEMRN